MVVIDFWKVVPRSGGGWKDELGAPGQTDT
jgi:hypothetical protein